MALASRLSFRKLRDALSRIVYYRDPYTDDHCARVMDLAVELGRACGLTVAASRIVAVGAQFHDIGKVGIPDAVLLKPGVFTKAEYETIQNHCVIGANIIRQVDSPGAADLTPLVLYHHERFDGDGYPERLAGNDIPLGARIIAVVDSFDAMTSPRSYRPPMSNRAALEIIRQERGAQFDPFIAESFLRTARA